MTSPPYSKPASFSLTLCDGNLAALGCVWKNTFLHRTGFLDGYEGFRVGPMDQLDHFGQVFALYDGVD